MRHFFATLLAFVLITAPAFAQPAPNPVSINSSNGLQATVNGNSEIRVNIEGANLFADTFDLPVSAPVFDTTLKWTSTSGGGGVAAAITSPPGAITLGSGTTANGFSCVVTKPAFTPVAPGFLVYGFRIQLPASLPVNSYAFWGASATRPGSPTVAAPVTEGIGLEITTTGKLQAVSYAAGAGRTLIADLSPAGTNKQPLDGATYTYYQYFRGDKFYWALTDQDNVVATGTGAQGPNINTMQATICAIANSVAPASSLTITVPAVFVGDNGHNGMQIADGVSQWLKATVSPQGALFAGGVYNYTHITTDATTILKTTPALLHSICLNTPVSTETITVGDSATIGTPTIAAITVIAAEAPSCLTYDIQTNTGLTVVTAIAAGDITVAWK